MLHWPFKPRTLSSYNLRHDEITDSIVRVTPQIKEPKKDDIPPCKVQGQGHSPPHCIEASVPDEPSTMAQTIFAYPNEYYMMGQLFQQQEVKVHEHVIDAGCLMVMDENVKGVEHARESAKYFNKIMQESLNQTLFIDTQAFESQKCLAALDHILTDFFLSKVLDHLNEEVEHLQSLSPEILSSTFGLYPSQTSLKRPYIFKLALENLVKRYTH